MQDDADLQQVSQRITMLTQVRPICCDVTDATDDTKNKRPVRGRPARECKTDAVPIDHAAVARTLIATIVPPMRVLTNAGGPIYDTDGVAVVCALGHAHKHAWAEVAKKAISCRTCCGGNKFSNAVRAIADKMFGTPFLLQPGVRGTYVYRSSTLPITICCCTVGKSAPADPNNYQIMLYTCGRSKIRPAIAAALSAWSDKPEGIPVPTARRPARPVMTPIPETQLPHSSAIARHKADHMRGLVDDYRSFLIVDAPQMSLLGAIAVW